MHQDGHFRMVKNSFRILCLTLILWVTLPLAAQQETPTPPSIGPTLNSIRSRGQLSCGVDQNQFGFGYLDPNTGEVTGFQVDLCRAIATAIFGDPLAVEFPPFNDPALAIEALRSGSLDILMTVSPVTINTAANGLEYGPTYFFSGQSILTRSDELIADWAALAGRSVCVVTDSLAQSELPAHMRRLQLSPVQLVPQVSQQASFQALQNGQCDAQSADYTDLAILRQRSGNPTGFTLWEGSATRYTSQPYAPLIRYGDDQWSDIVSYTLYGLINAEQYDITSELVTTLERQRVGTTGDPETDTVYLARVGSTIASLVDENLGFGIRLGLANNFMLAVIRDVGNYGEIFNRNFGTTASLPLPRGLNNLVQRGGLIYAPLWR